jgi:hypothetical protein
MVMVLTYIVEIELPSSGNWFKYFTGIESREEAEGIRCVAEGKLKARVRNEWTQGCEMDEKRPFKDNCWNTAGSEEWSEKDAYYVSVQPQLSPN